MKPERPEYNGGEMSDRSEEVGHRHYVRLPVSMPVIGRTLQPDTADLQGTVRNIGGGGLMAEFPILIFPGSVMDLTLRTRHGPFVVTGQVAWAGPPGPQVAHGIAFSEPRGDDFAKELVQREQC